MSRTHITDEDNWIDQVVAQSVNNSVDGGVVLLGDDTWTQCFPHQLDATHSHALPSFDVHDLHTVDDGVLHHLYDELERPDGWRVLIAHFLGVDHCGHKYGPMHEQMTRKLVQMNDMYIPLTANDAPFRVAHLCVRVKRTMFGHIFAVS
jgi:phosphatidylinositol glycan class O